VKRKINIAIDGYSSCGKSTLAKSIAKELNYVYIDTGAMYRAVTLHALKSGIIKSKRLNEKALLQQIDSIYITFKYSTEAKQQQVYLNGVNVEKEIRSMQVSNHVSEISTFPEVRQKMVKLQKRMAESLGVVMDGRDIGTVVLPNAALKIFMTAEPEVRAKRRFEELIGQGVDVTLEEVLANIESRDSIDSSRKADPLKQAEDAIVLDNSNLTIEEQFQFILRHAYERIDGETVG